MDPHLETCPRTSLAAAATQHTVTMTVRDLVATNVMGRALYAPHYDADGTPNIARFVFLAARPGLRPCREAGGGSDYRA